MHDIMECTCVYHEGCVSKNMGEHKSRRDRSRLKRANLENPAFGHDGQQRISRQTLHRSHASIVGAKNRAVRALTMALVDVRSADLYAPARRRVFVELPLEEQSFAGDDNKCGLLQCNVTGRDRIGRGNSRRGVRTWE